MARLTVDPVKLAKTLAVSMNCFAEAASGVLMTRENLDNTKDFLLEDGNLLKMIEDVTDDFDNFEINQGDIKKQFLEMKEEEIEKNE